MPTAPMLGDHSSWSWSIQNLETDAQQALWYEDANYDDVIDKATSGMYMSAQRYKTSFWIEGAKYVQPHEPFSVMVVFSTAESNIAGRYEKSKPY